MEQGDLLLNAIRILEENEVPYLLVGSLASGAYGEPRLTHDIDIVVDLSLSKVSAICEAFPSQDFYVSIDAAREAVKNRRSFNVIHPASGNKIDFLVARNDEWGRTQMTRRKRIPVLPTIDAYTAHPEDVILGKLLYYQEGGSEKHLRDICGMMRISSCEIDLESMKEWSEKLGVAEEWQIILDRLGE